MLTLSSLQPRLCGLVSWHFMPGMICLFICDEHLQRMELDVADLLWRKFSSGSSYLKKFIKEALTTGCLCVCLCICKVCIGMVMHVLDILYTDHDTYVLIFLLAGVRSSHPVLWALLGGEPVWASALTAWPAKLWSWSWWNQECLQQQEHLSALTLALLPVLQELSHLPLPILHLWTTCPAYWKVSNFFFTDLFPLLKSL